MVVPLLNNTDKTTFALNSWRYNYIVLRATNSHKLSDILSSEAERRRDEKRKLLRRLWTWMSRHTFCSESSLYIPIAALGTPGYEDHANIVFNQCSCLQELERRKRAFMGTPFYYELWDLQCSFVERKEAEDKQISKRARRESEARVFCRRKRHFQDRRSLFDARRMLVRRLRNLNYELDVRRQVEGDGIGNWFYRVSHQHGDHKYRYVYYYTATADSYKGILSSIKFMNGNLLSWWSEYLRSLTIDLEYHEVDPRGPL